MACKLVGDISYFDGTLLIIIQITALFGNCLFFIGLIKYPSLRNSTNILLCALATADIIVALGPMSMTFAVYVCSWGPRSQAGGDIISKAYLFTDVWTGTVSIWCLAVIAIDRYFAIEWPFLHQRVMKPSLAVGAVVIVWMISAVMASIRLVSTIPRRQQSLTNIMISFAVPLLIMLFCYINIAKTARRQMIRIAELNAAGKSIRMQDEADKSTTSNGIAVITEEQTSQQPSSESSEKNTNQQQQQQQGGSKISRLRRGTLGVYRKVRSVGKELKAAKMLAVVMGAFIVTWTPFMSLIIISYMYCSPPQPKCYEMLTLELSKYLKFLHYFSSALNPCLYVLLNKKWREAFRQMLFCSRGNRLSHESQSSFPGGW
eukprot:gene18227-20045_t